MTEIRVAPAGTRDELASFLAIGEVVHPGPRPSIDGLEHELARGAGTVFLLASLRETAVGTGVGKRSSVGDAYYSMVRVHRPIAGMESAAPYSRPCPITRGGRAAHP